MLDRDRWDVLVSELTSVRSIDDKPMQQALKNVNDILHIDPTDFSANANLDRYESLLKAVLYLEKLPVETSTGFGDKFFRY